MVHYRHNSRPIVKGVLVIAFFVFHLFNASAQQVDLKQNEQLKNDVYQQILNDSSLFNDFINEMRQNEQSMEWMRANRLMMGRMYNQGQMQRMMQNNPEMRQQMMRNMKNMMKKDSAMHRQMHNMMYEDPEMRRQMRQMMHSKDRQDTDEGNMMDENHMGGDDHKN